MVFYQYLIIDKLVDRFNILTLNLILDWYCFTNFEMLGDIPDDSNELKKKAS